VELLGEPTHDSVVVVPYDPSWPARFAALRDLLAAAFAPFEHRVEHVGSTSVPGLGAKPIVDIQVSVADIDDEDAYRPAIESLGWPLRSREPGHRYFRTPKGVYPRIQVHVCQTDGAWERDHLLFRDYLRTHPERAQAYEELKQALAERYSRDRLAYTEAKTPFIDETLRLAEAWAAEIGWEP
jgi:GrpB-like predicted nucleotidyltransferase (UPF0157 family)